MKKIFIGCVLLLSCALSFAQNELELLNEPSLKSRLASKSVLLNVLKTNDSFIAVGERGHIISWKTDQEWTQYSVPASVTITDITALNNGNFVAVGHDGLILLFNQESQEWSKVFDGYQLIELLISSLEQQIKDQLLKLENLTDDADRYDEQYYLEDLQFALEDARKEKAVGPNKPLLSVITADNGNVFATGAYGTLLQSKDGGLTWQFNNDKLDNVDKFHLNAISKDAKGTLFIVGENGVSARSTDDGESWEHVSLPYRGSFFGIETSPTSDHVVAFGLQGHIALSKDSGVSWTLLPKKLSTSFLGGTIDDNGMVYLVGHGGLIVSFTLTEPEQQNIYKHPSGSTFASVILESDKKLVLVGQLGINRWTVGN